MSETKHQPYEMLAEQVTAEIMERLKEGGYDNRYRNYLPEFLAVEIHRAIELGIGLGGFHADDDVAGPVEVAEAYLDGYVSGSNLNLDGEN